MAPLFWLSDRAWAVIDPHLPHGRPGRPRVDDRRVVSGILHLLKTGCRPRRPADGSWREVPAEDGPAGAIDNRYHRLRGRPVAFALTAGNVADISMAAPLLGAVAPAKRLIAANACDADGLRRWLKARRIEAVIRSTASRAVPSPLDRAAYRRRNLIERRFGRLKNWRRLATRYHRLAQNDLAALALIAVVGEWA